MRILLAYDGSAGADQARDCLAGLNLPEGTTITVVGALQPPPALGGGGSSDEGRRTLLDDLEAELEDASRSLAASGRTVEQRALVGRPAEVILAEASRLGVDLIVTGSRGHGPFKSALLGSVSTELVTASMWPVLVARGSSARRVLFATDGTETSALALDIVATWPIFAQAEITVLSVSEPFIGWAATDPTAMSPRLLELEAELADERRAVHAEAARAAAQKLRKAGRSATDEVRVGNPAHEIVQLADASGAELIVTGSRRSSGAFPAVLGSVARNVLHHANVSVLVVRHPTTPAAERAALEDLVAAEQPPEIS